VKEKDIAQTVFRCAEAIKKTSSANINMVAHRQKTKVFLGFFYNLQTTVYAFMYIQGCQSD